MLSIACELLPRKYAGVTILMRKTIFLLCLIGLLLAGIAAQNIQGTADANPHSQQQAGHTYHFSLSIHRIMRIDQLDPAQYNSAQDYSLWAYSACSTAAMAEVANFYGHHYRIADILKVQASLGEITPKLGLVEDAGIARSMAKFGFTTMWGYRWTLDQVIQLANRGTPVIVGWPPSRYDGGHLVVVTSGTSSTISIADSSRFNRRILTRAQFMQWWAGFVAIVTPAQGVQL